MSCFLTIWFACAPMYGISDAQKVLLIWIWIPFQNEFQCVWKLFITILILEKIWHFGFLLRHVICFCCVNISRKFGTSQVKAQFYVRNSQTVSAVLQVGAAGVCGPHRLVLEYWRSSKSSFEHSKAKKEGKKLLYGLKKLFHLKIWNVSFFLNQKLWIYLGNSFL